jgi:hypothetical protein
MNKAFIVRHKAYYSKILNKKEEEIYIGDYSDDDGCSGEFNIEWEHVGNNIYPRLKMFDDSWKMFNEMPELFQELAKHDNESFTVDQCVEMLLKLGYEDQTAYSRKLDKCEIEQLEKNKESLLEKIKEIDNLLDNNK